MINQQRKKTQLILERRWTQMSKTQITELTRSMKAVINQVKFQFTFLLRKSTVSQRQKETTRMTTNEIQSPSAARWRSFKNKLSSKCWFSKASKLSNSSNNNSSTWWQSSCRADSKIWSLITSDSNASCRRHFHASGVSSLFSTIMCSLTWWRTSTKPISILNLNTKVKCTKLIILVSTGSKGSRMPLMQLKTATK